MVKKTGVTAMKMPGERMGEKSVINLPKILLVTDSLPHPMATGTAKTLYNLLHSYPAEKLIIFCEPGEENGVTDRLPGALLPVRLTFIPQWANRLGALGYNRVADWVNGWLRRLLRVPKFENTVPKPDLLLLATLRHPRVITAYHLASGMNIPILPYVLDFWHTDARQTFGGFSLQETLYRILKQAKGWMVISRSLQHQIESYLQWKAPNTLIIHNPAVHVAQGIAKKPHSANYIITYAGSLYDMHFDTLLAAAKAIQLLQYEGLPARLRICCGQEHWNFRRHLLEPLGVIYAGFLEPRSLMNELRQSGLLLVTASFAESERRYSACSLQTKVTEYMGSGVPIVSIGPEYGECNFFFREHRCGFVVSENFPEEIATALRKIWDHPEELQALAEKALAIAKGYFGQAETQKRLFVFLADAYQTT